MWRPRSAIVWGACRTGIKPLWSMLGDCFGKGTLMRSSSASLFIAAVVGILAWAAAPAGALTVDVVADPSADALERFAASELQRCLTELFDASVRLVPAPEETADHFFYVGTSGRSAGTPCPIEHVPTLSDQGFLLRSMTWHGKAALAIVGGSPTATMWGVYELGERYGIRYLLSGDVFPPKGRPFFLPELDKTFEPDFRVRMWKTMGDFAMGMEGWGMEEYRPFIDQLAKLKFNRIRVSSGPSQPFLGLSVRGVKNASATLWYGAHFPITGDMPGRALFGREAEFWNPDLPLPDAGGDALVAAGERHCHELVAYAHSRGIDSNFVGSITDFPKEFAGLLPETQPVQQLGALTVSPGPTVRPDNPELLDVAGTILRTLVGTFPEIDSYGFPVGTEWPSWIDLYASAWEELNARYHIDEITSLNAVLQAAAQRTAYTGGPDRAVRQVKGDLAGLCFLDRLRTDPEIFPKTAKPEPRLIYYEVAEELFPILPRILPKSAELLVVLDYTPTRVLRRPGAFDKIPAKEIPTILALTLQDDGVGVPPQLTTGSLHKLVGEMRAHGLAGFCTRQWMISDLDPSVAYLAKAAWDSGATPEATSRDLIAAVCGENAVEPMLEAFREVEAVTAALEDHGLGLGFPVPSMMMGRWAPDSFPKELAEDREGYRRALAAMQKASPARGKEGQDYIAYWIGRLQFAVQYFDTLETVAAAATAEQAAKAAKEKGDETGFGARLREAADRAAAAQSRSFQAIETFAKVARNQSDRGAVATMAEYIYRPLKRKAEELRAQLPPAAPERYPLEQCILEVGPPVEVGRAEGHFWFPSLHVVPGAEGAASPEAVLCEVTLSADEAQGEWPAALCLTQDGGASWHRVRDIPCAGPASTPLGPRKLLLMPYETWPLAPGDKKNAKAEGSIVTLGDDGSLSVERTPMSFLGFPRELADYHRGEVYLLTNGNILPRTDGALFTTLYGKFAGDNKDSCWAMSSADRGATWQFRATVASGPELAGAMEGANESNTCRLADGRLMTICRTGAACCKSYSADDGATWTTPEFMEGVFSVEPQLLRLANGVLLISGGRPGLFVWTCSDGEGKHWERVNLAQHHNLHVPDPALHFAEALCEGRGADPAPTTSYTGMAAIGPDEALVCYDRLGNGWAGAPGTYGAFDAVFSVRLKLTPAKAPAQPLAGKRLGPIFNNDINNILHASSGKDITVDEYRTAVHRILDLSPGLLAQNVGMPDPVIYRSNVATTWDKYHAGVTKAVWPETSAEDAERQSAAMRRLLELGTDPFTITIQACRERGVPIVASYRMNAEDFCAGELDLSDFGRGHKDLRIPGRDCLDPLHPEVFQHRMEIFTEVANEYDIDGIEFDFRRWYCMISDPLTNYPVLTRMIAATRKMLDETAARKGRKMILGVRVGPMLDGEFKIEDFPGAYYPEPTNQSCRKLGLDVKAWVEQRLVDYICPALFSPIGLPRTKEFTGLAAGTEIGVYPTISYTPRWAHFDGPTLPDSEETRRRHLRDICMEALACYGDGADGVSLFNWFPHCAPLPGQEEPGWGHKHVWPEGYRPDARAFGWVQQVVMPKLADPGALRDVLSRELPEPLKMRAVQGSDS